MFSVWSLLLRRLFGLGCHGWLVAELGLDDVGLAALFGGGWDAVGSGKCEFGVVARRDDVDDGADWRCPQRR